MSSLVSLSILDSKVWKSLGLLLTKGCTAEGGACFPPGTAQPVQCLVSSTAWQSPASDMGLTKSKVSQLTWVCSAVPLNQVATVGTAQTLVQTLADCPGLHSASLEGFAARAAQPEVLKRTVV